MQNDDIDLGAALDQGEVVDAEFFAVEESLPVFSAGKLSITPISLNLVPFEQEVVLYRAKANSIIINDIASLIEAVEVKNQSKLLKNKLEKMRVDARAPYLEHLKNIQNIFKILQDPLEECEDIINKKQGAYDHQLLLERRRKEAEAREEQRQRQAELDEEARVQRMEAERKAREAAEKLKSEQDVATMAALEKEIAEETAAAQAPSPQMAPIVAEKPEVIRTAHGSSWTQFKWVCRVVESDRVPREYCEPVQKLLDAATKGGIRQIDGCVIEEVAIPKTRV